MSLCFLQTPFNVSVGVQSSLFSVLCLCVYVCLWFQYSLCAKPQPVSLTNPSCNSDISGPVLAGEEDGGGSGDYLMLSQLSEEPRRTTSDIFTNI